MNKKAKAQIHEAILREYRKEIRVFKKQEWNVKKDERRNVWVGIGFRVKQNYLSTKEQGQRYRLKQKRKMESDPAYKESVLSARRIGWRRRRYSEAQIARRRETERQRYHSKWKHDPAWKIKHNLRVRLAKYINGNKSCTMARLVGCSFNALIRHLEAGMRRGMNWKNYGTKWEVDHIVPCSLFDLSKPQEQAKCFHYSNLRPCLKSENRSKGAKIVTCQPELQITLPRLRR